MRRLAYVSVLFGCLGLVAQAATAGPPPYSVNPNPVLFPTQAHPTART